MTKSASLKKVTFYRRILKFNLNDYCYFKIKFYIRAYFLQKVFYIAG